MHAVIWAKARQFSFGLLGAQAHAAGPTAVQLQHILSLQISLSRISTAQVEQASQAVKEGEAAADKRAEELQSAQSEFDTRARQLEVRTPAAWGVSACLKTRRC